MVELRPCFFLLLIHLICFCLCLCLFCMCVEGGGVVLGDDHDGTTTEENTHNSNNNDNIINIWPMPASVSCGNQTLVLLGKRLRFTTVGTKFYDTSGMLKEGFQTLLEELGAAHSIDNVLQSELARGTNLRPPVVMGINVLIHSADEQLTFGVDESYHLVVPAFGNPLFIHLEAQTIYGALHGLQTLSQLCQFDLDSRKIELYHAPWTIFDQPRFMYRGLLIDTSRHYQPLKMIKSIIDAMSYAKLNVLHWHIVDEQSFPLEVPSFPKLWEGAYSVSERYTVSDAQEIVRYAQRRGIHVLAEIDIPGHARSWGIGYPALWPSPTCQEPLDVSNSFSFRVIDGILSDFSKVFKFRFVHLGGDEVNTSCWSTTPHIKRWLDQHHMSEADAYKYFVLRAQNIALSHGYEMINWEETFNNFGRQLNPKTVVHNWIGPGVARRVVEAGFRCIVSNSDKWYLDHLDARWEGFYENEPLEDISDVKQQELVLGGEVCMWGETADASDVQQTIWPRAAAAAERLWSPVHKLGDVINGGAGEVGRRLARFRCLLNERGIAAAPLTTGLGRAPPLQPGSCLKQ